MTRPVWIWTESAGTQLGEKPNISESVYGDGYSQRQANGMNAIASEWQMRFSGVENDIATEMIDFLRDCGGVTAFEYTPLWSTEPQLYTCAEWTRTAAEDPNESDITAVFKRRFEP